MSIVSVKISKGSDDKLELLVKKSLAEGIQSSKREQADRAIAAFYKKES